MQAVKAEIYFKLSHFLEQKKNLNYFSQDFTCLGSSKLNVLVVEKTLLKFLLF